MDGRESLERFAKELEFLANYEDNVSRAVKFISMNTGGFKPAFGITLGSGMGSIADIVDKKFVFNYSELPDFPVPKIDGHAGQLILGQINETPVAVFSGRTHYYDFADGTNPNPMRKVVFPIYVLGGLGAKSYIGMNATGGLNESFWPGDIMIVDSHINMLPNPLLGRQVNQLRMDNNPQERFPQMSDAYNSIISGWLKDKLARSSQNKFSGVLVAVTGPTYESPAEAKLYRSMGADAVGMSTVPEVIVASSLGMNCTGISIIANAIDKDGINNTNHHEVLVNVQKATKNVSRMFKEYF